MKLTERIRTELEASQRAFSERRLNESLNILVSLAERLDSVPDGAGLAIRGGLYQAIGHVHFCQGHYDDAILAYNVASNQFGSMCCAHDQLWTDIWIAVSHMRLRRFSRAEVVLNQVCADALRLGDDAGPIRSEAIARLAQLSEQTGRGKEAAKLRRLAECAPTVLDSPAKLCFEPASKPHVPGK